MALQGSVAHDNTEESGAKRGFAEITNSPKVNQEFTSSGGAKRSRPSPSGWYSFEVYIVMALHSSLESHKGQKIKPL